MESRSNKTIEQNAIDIVKKFMPYANGVNRQFEFPNAVECARIFIANAKLICTYVSRKDRDSVAEFRSPDYQFVDFWIEVENELNDLTLEDVE